MNCNKTNPETLFRTSCLILRGVQFAMLIYLFASGQLFAQSTQSDPAAIPFKSAGSPLFGKDIIINDIPVQNQRNAAICSAFNGWLYAIYSYRDQYGPRSSTLCSKDSGYTWNLLMDGYVLTPSSRITHLNIIACGNSISELKIFISVAYRDTVNNFYDAYIFRYNGEPFSADIIVLEQYHAIDLTISSDYGYSPVNTNPFSFSTLFSREGFIYPDSIIYMSSGNGGTTLDNKQILTTSDKYLHKVALSYGIGNTYNTGRYYAVWEEQDDEFAGKGHLYTSHSEPNYNSSFTSPVCLDSLEPGLINNLSNPSVSCQYGDFDNGNNNITEAIVSEKYNSTYNNENLIGFSNIQSTISDSFIPFNIFQENKNVFQPDMAFNPYNKTFILTCFDSTDVKLPYLTHDFNMNNPGIWNIVDPGYNDTTNLTSPDPRIILNPVKEDAAFIWSGDHANGNGIATFDAAYSTYTTVPPNNNIDFKYQIFPNPCNTFFNVECELKEEGYMRLQLYAPTGQFLETLLNRSYTAGHYSIIINISSLSSGYYVYKLTYNEQIYSGKIVVVR
jgi:hypothetical protein